MKANIKVWFVLCIILSVRTGFAQELNLSWKRMLDLALYANHDERKYTKTFFQTINLYVERPLENKHFSLGIDLAYSNVCPNLRKEYEYLGNSTNFFDRSFSIGFIGRAYTRPRSFRAFVELGAYANYLHIHQPIVIEHSFGTYDRIIDSKSIVLSASGSIGISLGNDKLRWEPYVQWGVMPEVEDKRAGMVYISSIGIVQTNYAFFITPAAFKVNLF